MSVWNNRYLRFQCNPHTAGNLPEVVYIHCRPFLLKQAEQSAEDDLELKKNIILFLGQLFSWFFQILIPSSYMQRLYLNLFFPVAQIHLHVIYWKYFLHFYVNFSRGSSYMQSLYLNFFSSGTNSSTRYKLKNFQLT